MAQRKMTPRGQMTSGSNGPAIMMMPPHIRATFMPDPPLKFVPRIVPTRKHPWTGMSDFLNQFEKTRLPDRIKQQQQQQQQQPSRVKEVARKRKEELHQASLQPLIEEYRKAQKETGGEVDGMNCYNTLFVGRLAHEVTERKLLREMEQFGPIKDLKIIKDDKTGKSKGFAFCEYENEEDMKRAYRAADGMRIEGREIVVDVERGHTVPGWLPRRLGGGLGGTRLGGKDKNVTAPGRFDPSRPEANRAPPPMMMGGMGRGGGPPPPYHDRGGRGPGGHYRDGPDPPPFRDGPPPPYGRGGGGYGPPRGEGPLRGDGPPRGDRPRGDGPPRGGPRDEFWERGPPRGGGGGGYGGGYNDRNNDRKRGRSRSPERRGNDSRRRY